MFSLFLIFSLETTVEFKLAALVSTCLFMLTYSCTAFLNPGVEIQTFDEDQVN
jgi:hypothetical protein